MPLSAGDKLGPYEILFAVGTGGMGEVYKARDTRLGRTVAIKTSHGEFSSRFQLEARAVAALNHRHICQLYDIGDDYIVMEMVEGETLASRLQKGRLPMDLISLYGAQIADALAAAHAEGIIHRDLKPANIMVTKSGIKVLDFGLAKFTQVRDSGGSETDTRTASQTILGTPAYMAPEQFEGKECDARTDIFALGLVLYEMATGRRAAAATPPLEELAPRNFAHVVEQCLARDADRRWHSASDVKLELEWLRKSRPAPQVNRPLIRLSVSLGPDATAGLRTTAVLSPDGHRLGFFVRGADGIQRLATRRLDEIRAAPLAGTENGQDPFFSPDGQWLGFFADHKLKRISVQGGSPVTICEAPNDRGASWGEDNTIVMAPHFLGGLYRVPVSGGSPQQLTRLQKDEVSHAWPQILPGGKTVLFTCATAAASNIQVVSLQTGETQVVARDGYRGRYMPSGHLVYVHHGTLFAVPFDIASLDARGVPVPLLDDVADSAGDLTAHFDFGGDGAFVYFNGKSAVAARTPVCMEPSGKIQPFATKLESYKAGRLSPDGRYLAAVCGFPDSNIWVQDVQRGASSRLTFTTTGNMWPVWAPDGRHLVFSAVSSVGRTIWWIRADGAGEPRRLLDSSDEIGPTCFSPDGTGIVFQQRSAETRYDIWILPLDTTNPEYPNPGRPEPFLRTPANEWGAVFSPSGRWMAYYSEESGAGEIYVRPVKGPGGPWLVSSGWGSSGAAYPIAWPRECRALYFLSSDRHIVEVAYSEKANLFVPKPARVWSETPIPFNLFDMNPAGQRAVIATPVAAEPGNLHVTFLLNFLDELRRRVPVESSLVK